MCEITAYGLYRGEVPPLLSVGERQLDRRDCPFLTVSAHRRFLPRSEAFPTSVKASYGWPQERSWRPSRAALFHRDVSTKDAETVRLLIGPVLQSRQSHRIRLATIISSPSKRVSY